MMPDSQTFLEHARAFARAKLVVRGFYSALFFLAARAFLFPAREGFLVPDAERCLWPVLWVRWVGVEAAAPLLAGFFFFSTLAAAIRPWRRWSRLLACVGTWEYVAYMCSYGHMFPLMHQWAGISFLLIFLPDACEVPGAGRRLRQSYLRVVWTCQAFLLLTYSMAGLSKILTAAYQGWLGQTHGLSAGGLAMLIAGHALETGRMSPWGDFLMAHARLAWGLHLSVMIFQLFSFPAAFHPSLHRRWACGLILFHLGTYLALGILFQESMLLAVLLLWFSPFRKEDKRTAPARESNSAGPTEPPRPA